MARDGSGNYNPPSPENPVVSGTTIDADDHNTTISDISAALTASIAKDGQTVPTGDLPMGGFKHTNVGVATARNQYATVAGIQDDTYNKIGSISGTNTITGSASPAISAYVDQSNWIFVPFASNTGAATLNVNGVAARAIVTQDGNALSAGDLAAGVPAHVVYDLPNTRWVLINPNVFTTGIGTSTQAWDADLDALAGVSSNGMLARTGAGTAEARTITGTADRVTITNGDGVAGDPTLDIAATYAGQTSINTVGTITTGTWQGTTIAVNQGGTGTTTSTGTGSVVLSASPTFSGTVDMPTLNAAVIDGRFGNAVSLYGENTTLAATTQDRTATGATTGLRVNAHSGIQYDVGFNELPIFNWETSDTLEASHCGHVTGASTLGGQTLTLAASGDLDFPIGGITMIINGDTLNYNVDEGSGTQLNYLEPGTGQVDTTGGCTIGPGGVATIWRFNAAIYYIWGSEISYTP